MSAWKRLIALCTIKLVDDTKKTQTVQLDLGPRLPDGEHEIHDGAFVLNPYGLTSNPPAESDAIVLFLNAERSLAVVTGMSPKAGRPVGLKPGEVALFNALTGAMLVMSAGGGARFNGDVEVEGNLSVGSGCTGSFPTGAGQTVTVQDGIITNID